MAPGAYDAILNPDINRYLNPYTPKNFVGKLPRPIAHFLGYRAQPPKEPVILVQWLNAFIGTVLGLCAVAAAYTHAPGLKNYHPPILVASLGATAVLDYNTIKVPLAQPRNAIFGHTVSAIAGVAVSKLFQLHPSFESSDLPWVSASIGCAAASVLMAMTDTVHPPGGATAVLASSDAGVRALGWMFIPFVMLGTIIMAVVALLVNNCFRRYPTYWWVAATDIGGKLPGGSHSKKAEEIDETKKPEPKDIEKGSTTGQQIENNDTTKDSESENQLEKKVSMAESDRTLQPQLTNTTLGGSENASGLTSANSEIRVLGSSLHIPEHVVLTAEEKVVLQKLQTRLGA